MEVAIHYKDKNYPENIYAEGSSNYHVVPCQQMQFVNGFIEVSFSPKDLKDPKVILMTKDMELFHYADSTQKYIKLPCEWLYSAKVRTDMR